MPNWLVSRAMSNAAKANGSENAQCGRDKKNAKKMNAENGTCEDAERGNVKKENTKKEYEDAGNKNVAEKMNGRRDERVRNARRRIGRWQRDAHARRDGFKRNARQRDARTKLPKGPGRRR